MRTDICPTEHDLLNELLYKVALFIDLFVDAIMMSQIYVTDIIDMLASCHGSDITV